MVCAPPHATSEHTYFAARAAGVELVSWVTVVTVALGSFTPACLELVVLVCLKLNTCDARVRKVAMMRGSS